MNPTNAIYQKQLKDFLLQFWMYYDWLVNYKKFPTPELKQQLQDDFDVLFSIETLTTGLIKPRHSIPIPIGINC